MSLPLLAAAVIAVLVLGYRFYGRFVAQQYNLDGGARTPAHEHADGVDFVPTRPFYLFGQHFSAIAAAGPIVGPILACQYFGWLPCILWITVGVIFIGAVHDFSTLVASVRHGGRSIAEVVKAQLGREAWLAILTFIWLALIYVIVAFVDITAGTFVTGDTETRDLVHFNQGGAVALASILYLGVALVMGACTRLFRMPLWLATLIFVPATVAAVWAGTQWSTVLTFASATEAWKTWVVLILGYCFFASLSPMWLLLQPRGYLGGFVLYAALFIGTVGIFFGGFAIQQPMYKGFDTPAGGLLFPFLFVTIACGACSGFHGLVCSGTTSKQIDRETHCHPIGYGAMLLEAFVAVIALATVMIVAPGSGGKPGALYAAGLGSFLQKIFGLDHQTAITFGAMALSTFVFDTLDSATRLGRYILQELFGTQSRLSGAIATGATVGAPLLVLMTADSNSFQKFWSLFGTSNQLLAALSLLAITVWLKRQGRRYWFAAVPMVFVMAVTVVALVLHARQLVQAAVMSTSWLNGLVAVILLALTGALVWYATIALLRPTTTAAVATPSPGS